MKPGSSLKLIGPPDTFHLSAAIGWLELGNDAEAKEELKKLSPDARNNPDVLQLEWSLLSEAGDWKGALDVASAIVEAAPELPFGWIHRSYTLHEMKRTEEAIESLLPVAEKFPEEFIIPYNLACYTCQLGRLYEARSWLDRAVQVGGRERIREMGLSDPDLRPLWEEIRQF